MDEFSATDEEGVPTGMVFVPSVDGISHGPAEETDPAAIETGTEVLTRAILRDEF